jgi:hypothetical protein
MPRWRWPLRPSVATSPSRPARVPISKRGSLLTLIDSALPAGYKVYALWGYGQKEESISRRVPTRTTTQSIFVVRLSLSSSIERRPRTENQAGLSVWRFATTTLRSLGGHHAGLFVPPLVL